MATSIVSRRSSRSYSQQSFVSSSPFGHSATTTRSYTSTDHFYAANNLNYYQPNIFYYHSTPWHYRWGRAADPEARQRREARLVEVGDITTIPVNKISDVAANVSVAYNDDIWQNVSKSYNDIFGVRKVKVEQRFRKIIRITIFRT